MRYAFIIGFPRSGTTLLSGLLNSHSQICSTPETQFFSQTFRLNRFIIDNYAPKQLSFIYSKMRLNDLNITENKIAYLSKRSSGSLIDFYKTILIEYAKKKRDCKIILEKTPAHIRHINLINKYFPEAQIIAIVRDPRAAISSLMNTPWNKRSIKIAALEFNYEMRLLEKYKQRILIVKYEDLVSKPKQELVTCCHHLNLSFESEMLKNRGGGEVVPEWEMGWKENSKSPPKQDSLEKWKKNLNENETATIEKLNTFAFNVFGYDRTSSPTTRERFLAFAAHIAYSWARNLKNFKDRIRP